MKHAAQTLAGLAHQIADSARAVAIQTGAAGHRELAFAEVQQGVGRAAPAQLMIQAGQSDVIAYPSQFALCINQFLGNDEEGDTACTGYEFALGIRDLCQYQMDDVLAELVLTAGNPHLVASNPVTRA